MTSKFDELMKYIDDESQFVSESVNSSRRNSVISSQASRIEYETKTNSYIWDDDNQSGPEHTNDRSRASYDMLNRRPSSQQQNPSINNIDSQRSRLNSSSSRKPSAESNNYTARKYSSVSTSSSSSGYNNNHNNNNAMLLEQMKEIEVKIKSIKDEIKSKSKVIHDYHDELTRLDQAKQKRQQKFKLINENKLNETRKEYKEALDMQAKMMSKLNADIKELTIKHDALNERLMQLESTKQQTLEKTKKELNRKLSKMQAQQELEEKAYFEKVLSKKVDSMKKAAVDELAPKLDKFVADSRIKLQKRKTDIEINLQKLKTNLEHELDAKIRNLVDSNSKDNPSNQYQTEKMEKECRLQIEEAQQKQQDELKLLKDKHKRMIMDIEDKAEKLRQMDNEYVLERIKNLRASETEQLNTLRTRHQAELGKLAEECSQKLHDLKETIADEIHLLKKSLLKQTALETQKKLEIAKKEMTDRMHRETEEIIKKLKDESKDEQQTNQKKLDDEIKSLRMQLQGKIDDLQSQYKQVSETHRSLVSEIQSYEQNIEISKKKISHMKSQIEESEEEIKQIKSDIKKTKLEYEEFTLKVNESKRFVQKLSSSSSLLLSTSAVNGSSSSSGSNNGGMDALEHSVSPEDAVLQQELKALTERSQTEINDLMQIQEAELKRVNEKINTLYQRREDNIQNIRRQRDELLQQEHELSDRLQEERTKSIENR